MFGCMIHTKMFLIQDGITEHPKLSLTGSTLPRSSLILRHGWVRITPMLIVNLVNRSMVLKVLPLIWRRCPRRWSRSVCYERAMAATNTRSWHRKIPSSTATTTTWTSEIQNISGDGVSMAEVRTCRPQWLTVGFHYRQQVTKKWQQKTWKMLKSCTRNSIDGSCDCVIYLCNLIVQMTLLFSHSNSMVL